jgi:hypothetical protein
MTTPAFSHTYSYNRLGVGDVITLDGGGHPYTVTVSVPSGWTANYWWSADPLASVQDLSKWTQLLFPGPLPVTARKLAVNVLTVPGQTPTSARLEVNVSSNSYKSAHGARHIDSGAHAPAFHSNAYLLPGKTPEYWYDFTDLPNLFQDKNLIDPVTAIGQVVAGISNKGTVVQDLSVNVSDVPTLENLDGLGGHSYALFPQSPGRSYTALVSPTFDWTDGSRSFMCLYEWIDGGANTERNIFSSSSAAFVNHRINMLGGDLPQTLINGATGNFSILTERTPVAAIGEMIQAGGTDPFDYRISYEDNDQTGTNTLSAVSNISINVGSDEAGLNSHIGKIYEVACWVNGGDVPTLDELEAYVTTKYGLAWT